MATNGNGINGINGKKNNFEIIDGAYRITKDQSKDLTKFLLNKLETAGNKTPTGAWSKGKNFPAVYVDGVKKIFRNHKTKSTLNNWGLDDVQAKLDYSKDRTNKLIQKDELSQSKNAQMKADIDEMNMFEGYEKNDPDEYFIEHDSRVTDHAQIEGQGVKHGADDWHNQHPSKRKTGKVKTHLEGMANSWNTPWRVRTDPVTGESRVINLNEYDPNNYVGKGIVIDNAEEATAISESLRQGKLVEGADPNKVKYLISERVPIKNDLNKALEKFKVYGKDDTISRVRSFVNKTNSAKSTKLLKKGSRLIAGGIGTAFVVTNFTGKVNAAVKEPSAKNLGLAGLATADAVLEGLEYATGGLALPITTLLQAGIIGAETVIEDGTAKISTANRRRYRHGNR